MSSLTLVVSTSSSSSRRFFFQSPLAIDAERDQRDRDVGDREGPPDALHVERGVLGRARRRAGTAAPIATPGSAPWSPPCCPRRAARRSGRTAGRGSPRPARRCAGTPHRPRSPPRSFGTKKATMVRGNRKTSRPNAARPTKPISAPSRPIAAARSMLPRADVLPDQGRDRHRQAHRRDHDDLQHVRADAVGGERQRAEAGDQEAHHHQRARRAPTSRSRRGSRGRRRASRR